VVQGSFDGARFSRVELLMCPSTDAPTGWREHTDHLHFEEHIDALTGALAFIAYTERNVHLLLPPGASLAPDVLEDGSIDGEGLWTQARWSRDGREPIVDLHPPSAVRHVRTIHVLSMLGERHHGRVRSLVILQAEQARLLMRPAVGVPVNDRQAQRGARLLLALQRDAEEAFADADALVLRQEDAALELVVPDSCQELIQRIPLGKSTSARDREVGVRELARLMLSVLRCKLSRRRRALMTSDLPGRAEDGNDDDRERELAKALS
jgi:hypothetical protein